MKKRSYLWLLTALLMMALCFGGCSDAGAADDEGPRKEQRDEKSDEESEEKKDDEESKSEEKKAEEKSESAVKKDYEKIESKEEKDEEKSESVEKKDEEKSESAEKKDEEKSESTEQSSEQAKTEEKVEQKPEGGSGTTDSAIVGKWVSGSIDSLRDKLLEELDGFDEMGEYVNFDRNKLQFRIYYEFAADGKMYYGMEEESLRATMDYVASCLIEGAKLYVTQLLKDSGVDMEFGDYLSAVGMSEEEFEKQMRDELYQYVDSSEVRAEGFYVVKNGRLYAVAASEGAENMDYTESLSYTVSGDKLTLLAYYNEDGQIKDNNVLDELISLPLTLTRE